ncbi:hypothetical protein LTR17_021640 [Elasticomyces elasticus]|nr:hypothetical protein LTR17_021640 [Elasticomyces elasticus]
MATPYKIVISPTDMGNFHKGDYNTAAAAKASEALQNNLERWTIIFTGLRHSLDHIVHCILTILALGATPEEIQKNYDREASYQKPRYPIDEDVVEAIADKAKFNEYLSQQPHYSNFLLFFQREIGAKGVRRTLEEHVFADTEHAKRLFALLYCGIFHPYLHLGYAFEFNQPALVAEALAMACVHEPDQEQMGRLYNDAENLAGGSRQPGKKTLRQIMEEMRDNEALRTSSEGNNKIDRSKNVADNAAQEMINYAAQYSISDGQLEERVNEMIDTCSLLIASKPSSIKDEQPYKIDFFLLHSVNTLCLMPTLINHQWISRENSVRLMEWAGRCHLLNYMSQTAPPISPAVIDNYPLKLDWDQIFDRAINHPSDDGHLQKCIRSLAFGQKIMSDKYVKGEYQVKPGSWLRFANMVTDLVPWESKTSPERWLLSF